MFSIIQPCNTVENDVEKQTTNRNQIQGFQQEKFSKDHDNKDLEIIHCGPDRWIDSK